LAVTATYDLFKLKMLPSILEVFEHTLGTGRFWAGDRVLELRDPKTNEFWAKKSTDPMWGRIILRSADSLGGLESATARSAWLDEAGQDRFTLDAWRAIRRRLALFRGRILITTTLYNLGWIVQQVLDKATAGGAVTILRAEKGEVEHTINVGTGIDLIQFDSIINPVYPLEEFEEARAELPDDLFQMFYRGRKAKLRGLIYDIFDKDRHTCPRFPIPSDWERFLGLDFGPVNTAAVFFAQEPGTGRLYGYREYLAGGRTAKEHAEKLLSGEPGIPTKCIGGVSSEKQWLREFAQGGLPVRLPPVSSLGVGINRVYGGLKRYKVIFFDDLHGTLDQFGRYRRKRDRAGNLMDEIENKKDFHYLDAIRYILSAVLAERKEKGRGREETPSTSGERYTSMRGRL